MTAPATFSITETDADALKDAEGAVVIFVGEDGKLGTLARRANRLSRGAVERFVESDGFGKAKDGDVTSLGFPSGMAAEALVVVKLSAKPAAGVARKAGVAAAKAAGSKAVLMALGPRTDGAEIAEGLLLRRYDYTDQKSSGTGKTPGAVTLMVNKTEALQTATADLAALMEGVFLTRDLVNAPANVLSTTAYAEILEGLAEHGLEVEVLDEDRLAELGMGALLAVGQGSVTPSKVVVMKWMGGGDEAPTALVGKGVVFDTGGISLKPGAGMEDMTMDMGGSAVVSGVMKTLAMRKAKANVVGLVGLVENMPAGNAYRPGDVVTSMKGDTIEVINTDAEGRLVLADVLWYAQETYRPSRIVDLATLTGAIVIGLGHHNAGVFCNDDALAGHLLKAAEVTGEGAWRMPLGEEYAKQLESRIADVKNVGGRPAGSITAAEFLRRFVKDDMPWAHIDIAGVCSTSSDSPYAPKGASGWGVRALDRMIRDTAEG